MNLPQKIEEIKFNQFATIIVLLLVAGIAVVAPIILNERNNTTIDNETIAKLASASQGNIILTNSRIVSLSQDINRLAARTKFGKYLDSCIIDNNASGLTQISFGNGLKQDVDRIVFYCPRSE